MTSNYTVFGFHINKSNKLFPDIPLRNMGQFRPQPSGVRLYVTVCFSQYYQSVNSTLTICKRIQSIRIFYLFAPFLILYFVMNIISQCYCYIQIETFSRQKNIRPGFDPIVPYKVIIKKIEYIDFPIIWHFILLYRTQFYFNI